MRLSNIDQQQPRPYLSPCPRYPR